MASALALLAAVVVADQECVELAAHGLVVDLGQAAAAGDQAAARLAVGGRDLIGDDGEAERGAAQVGELAERAAGRADRGVGGDEQLAGVAGVLADLERVAGRSAAAPGRTIRTSRTRAQMRNGSDPDPAVIGCGLGDRRR